jgi:hypothetical protein
MYQKAPLDRPATARSCARILSWPRGFRPVAGTEPKKSASRES